MFFGDRVTNYQKKTQKTCFSGLQPTKNSQPTELKKNYVWRTQQLSSRKH